MCTLKMHMYNFSVSGSLVDQFWPIWKSLLGIILPDVMLVTHLCFDENGKKHSSFPLFFKLLVTQIPV